MSHIHYETDAEAFPAPAYKVKGCGGVAWWALGWQTEPDEDTAWSGQEARTGKVVMCMVGDDRLTPFDPDDITPLGEDDYCPECGQTGCRCYR